LTTRKYLGLDVFTIPDQDRYLSVADVKDVAEEVTELEFEDFDSHLAAFETEVKHYDR